MIGTTWPRVSYFVNQFKSLTLYLRNVTLAVILGW